MARVWILNYGLCFLANNNKYLMVEPIEFRPRFMTSLLPTDSSSVPDGSLVSAVPEAAAAAAAAAESAVKKMAAVAAVDVFIFLRVE